MKRIKMVLYAEPGVGKSVFASKAPNPFFICTDGNYEWLEDFGAKPEAHVNVSSWSEIKTIIDKGTAFNDYETVVLDLTEDAFKWCEQEYCVRNKIEHLSDLGYGKAYDATRNEFFLTISKLISYDKNVIMLMHGLSTVEKDRRGVEHTKYIPSSRIPDKVTDMIEGRVRYFLRAYVKDEVHEDGTVTKNRWLSVVPKPNEFGIIRGVDENKIPQDIPLEWSEFAKVIGYDVETKIEQPKKIRKPKEVEEPKEEVKEEPKITKEEPKEEIKQETFEEVINEEPLKTFSKEKIEELKEKVKEPVKERPKTVTNEDKLAAIKAKLAAINKK